MKKRIIIICSILIGVIAITFCVFKAIEINKLNKTFTYRFYDKDDPKDQSHIDIDSEISEKNILITGYKGYKKDIIIPSEIDGHKVTGIDREAFANNFKIESVTIPD